MILVALVEREGMYGDQVGLQRMKSAEINTSNQSLCVYEQVWMLELIVSRELHWCRHGNGMVDVDLSFGMGEESIGKNPGMGKSLDQC